MIDVLNWIDEHIGTTIIIAICIYCIVEAFSSATRGD